MSLAEEGEQPPRPRRLSVKGRAAALDEAEFQYRREESQQSLEGWKQRKAEAADAAGDDPSATMPCGVLPVPPEAEVQRVPASVGEEALKDTVPVGSEPAEDEENTGEDLLALYHATLQIKTGRRGSSSSPLPILPDMATPSSGRSVASTEDTEPADYDAPASPPREKRARKFSNQNLLALNVSPLRNLYADCPGSPPREKVNQDELYTPKALPYDSPSHDSSDSQYTPRGGSLGRLKRFMSSTVGGRTPRGRTRHAAARAPQRAQSVRSECSDMPRVRESVGRQYVEGPVQVETKAVLKVTVMRQRWVRVKGRWLEEHDSKTSSMPLRCVDLYCAHLRPPSAPCEIEIAGPYIQLPSSVFKFKCPGERAAQMWREGLTGVLSSPHCDPTSEHDSASCLRSKASTSTYESRRGARVEWLKEGLDRTYEHLQAPVMPNTQNLAELYIFEEFKLYVRLCVRYPEAKSDGRLEWLLAPPEEATEKREVGVGVDLEYMEMQEQRIAEMESELRDFFQRFSPDRALCARDIARVFVERLPDLRQVLSSQFTGKQAALAIEALGRSGNRQRGFWKKKPSIFTDSGEGERGRSSAPQSLPSAVSEGESEGPLGDTLRSLGARKFSGSGYWREGGIAKTTSVHFDPSVPEDKGPHRAMVPPRKRKQLQKEAEAAEKERKKAESVHTPRGSALKAPTLSTSS
eukprot:Hpha_TRINITY_DN15735_c1_g1::TRINITY_DN15735_c1_g1_i1::g.41933::m.41933